MPTQPTIYRVRLAFGFYSVGHTFVSPPMSRAYADSLRSRGYIEAVEEEKPAPKPEPKGRKK